MQPSCTQDTAVRKLKYLGILDLYIPEGNNINTRREGMGRIVRHVFLKMDLIVFKKISN
eukprot:SAG31_NODE_18042_length_648_cov_4.540984_1_plen_59_part_00